MKLHIKRMITLIDDLPSERPEQPPLRKLALAAVVDNPYAGQGYVEDLGELIQASIAVGETMGRAAVEAMRGYGIQGYGKGGMVGIRGEQEHINAVLTSDFANPVRELIGGGKAWISSVTKRAGPGEAIDIPLAHKDALYVRSHYDSINLRLPDLPGPDEIVLIMAFSSRARLNARVGGLRHEEVQGRDGLV